MQLAVVSGTDNGAQDFLDSVWTSGELFVDEDEAFKKALGGHAIKLRGLLFPSVISKAFSYTKRTGQRADDIKDPKTQKMGGTFVVRGGEVVFVHHETASFDNGDARAMLAAALGKDLKDLPPPSSTDKQEAILCSK